MSGTMLLMPLTDHPERFTGMEQLTVEREGKAPLSLKVRGIEPYGGKETFFCRLEGIDDRDAAEAFRGALVTVSPDERVELDEGEYWIDDIVGVEVFDEETGERLGAVEEVMPTGSNDVYLIRAVDGALKPIPATAETVRSVDVERARMTVRVPEGLWD